MRPWWAGAAANRGPIIGLVPTITGIERIRFQKRADIWLDGEKSFPLGQELIAVSGLAVGKELSEQEIATLRDKDEYERALQAALRLLSLGPRSEKDLRQRLRRRRLGNGAVAAAIDRMRELGYLDDAAYARSYVESRLASTPRSRRYLAFELGQKGVAKDLSDSALEGVSDDDAAYAAARRRLRSLSSLDYAAFQRRLTSFLAGRGFAYGTARTAVDRCWRELQDEVSE